MVPNVNFRPLTASAALAWIHALENEKLNAIYCLATLCKGCVGIWVKKAAAKGVPGVRKRKQPTNSSGPANSTGTANTAGPSPNSAPSTPSTHTPGDVMSMGALQHSGSISKPLLMYGADGTATLGSPSNQLVTICLLCFLEIHRPFDHSSLSEVFYG
jgi:hypothetical protein